MALCTADQVANYILRSAHDAGDVITNLKLQKLIYYAQAWYLALYDEPLFDEEFQAWVHGPVQRELYDRFKNYRWNPIEENPDLPTLPDEVVQHLDDILAEFGGYGAYELERMVHREDPWIKARKGLPPDEPSTTVISKHDMQEYYRSLL